MGNDYNSNSLELNLIYLFFLNFSFDRLEVHNNEIMFWKNILSIWEPTRPKDVYIFPQMVGNCQNTKARLNAFYKKFPHLKDVFIFNHKTIASHAKSLLTKHRVVIFIVCVSKGLFNSIESDNVHDTLFTIRKLESGYDCKI